MPASAAPPNPPPSVVNATLSPPPEGGSCGKYPCADDIDGWVQRLRVPPGFAVRHVARADGHPTSITYDPTGRLIVATMEGSILAYDTSGHAATIASGFHLPIGLAYRPGSTDLYVASRTFPREAVPNEGKVTLVHADGSQQDIVTGLPCCYTSDMHQPDSLAFGPDGKVYLSIGARADHGETPGQPDVPGELQPLEAGILRFNPDGSDLEKYASGLRNPYDLTFDARGQLFATDNSPDFGPPDRLLRIVPGSHYGYPYYANCQQCPPVPAGIKITPPYATFIPHAAATGITAYNGSRFPADYRNNLFVTLWSAFTGAQKVVRIQTSPFKMSDFVLGLADPIDVAVTPSGGLAVADWATGNVFEIRLRPLKPVRSLFFASHPLPQNLIHHDRSGHRRIQRIDLAAHGKFDQEVATLAHQAAHPFPFVAHHQPDRAAQIGLIERARFRQIVQPRDPDFMLFQFRDRGDEVSDLRHEHVLAGAG